MVQRFGARQPTVALLFWHLVNLVQLPNCTLLIGRGQAIETGIASQDLLLVLRGETAMFIEPFAQMS